MSDNSTHNAPWWAWASALMMAAVLMTATAVLGTAIAWEGDSAELHEHRALFQAHSLAAVMAQHDAATAQVYLQALGQQLPESIAEAFVIAGGVEDMFGISRGQRYVAAYDPALQGAELEQRVATGGRRDKTRVDRYAHTVSGVEAEVRPGRASPRFVLEQEQVAGLSLWSAQVPVVTAHEHPALGSAGFSIQNKDPGAPIPWLMFLVLLVLVAGVGLAFKGTIPQGQRMVVLRGLIATVGVLLLLVSGIHYRSALGTQVDISAEAFEHTRTAAQAAGLTLDAATAVMVSSDVAFTGEHGYLLGGGQEVPSTRPRLMAQARSTRGLGRVAVPLVSVAVALGVLLALSTFLVRLAVGLRKDTHAYVYILPSMVGMVVLVFVPFGFGVGMSLFDNDARRYYFVGLANFVEILATGKSGDVSFYWTLWVTILWTVLNVVLHVSVGLALALVLKDPLLKLRGVYRVLLNIPFQMSAVM
ncbi:MAG: hypothetical protein AAFX99_26245 [Myxococcota bacterium]